MKKLLLIIVVGLVGCAKHKFENKIQGNWTMESARLESMNHWEYFPNTESQVTITESSISNPWNTSYSIVGETIILNNQVVKIDVRKNTMLWVFVNSDSLRFVR
tara:strand:+ start:22002 stop:22313 length:312 start_codon:yes stop_codon:yes gene_type:complete